MSSRSRNRVRDRDPVCGAILVDKPAGMTSHDVVRAVRREMQQRRVGHAGTLDPLASGLLPVFLGRATRLVQYLHGWPKSYVGTITLGRESPTDDAESAASLDPGAPTPPAGVIARAVERLTGTYEQMPPSYSAKKIGGVAAHKLARRGLEPTLLPARVTVHRLRVVRTARPGHLLFAARVSSGTYIRSIARDLGRILGTGAFLGSLRRTGIGPLRAREGYRIGAPGGPAMAQAVIPPQSVPLPIERLVLERALLARFAAGNAVPWTGPGLESAPGTRFSVLAEDGTFLGIAELSGDGRLEPRAVFVDPPPAPDGPDPSIAMPGGA